MQNKNNIIANLLGENDQLVNMVPLTADANLIGETDEFYEHWLPWAIPQSAPGVDVADLNPEIDPFSEPALNEPA